MSVRGATKEEWPPPRHGATGAVTRLTARKASGNDRRERFHVHTMAGRTSGKGRRLLAVAFARTPDSLPVHRARPGRRLLGGLGAPRRPGGRRRRGRRRDGLVRLRLRRS